MSETTAASTTSGGRTSGRRGRFHRFRTPSDASFVGKKQGGEVELPDVLTSLEEAWNSGIGRQPWRWSRACVGKRQGKKRTTGRERERMREREASSGRPYPRVRSIGGGAHHCKGSGDGQLATELFDRGRKTTTVSWAWAVGGLMLLGCR
jgi:hypothetical protein